MTFFSHQPFQSFPLSLLSDMIAYISFIIYNRYIHNYISLFSLQKRLFHKKYFLFSVRTCDNTTSPNIGGRMHGPASTSNLGGVPSSPSRSPPMDGGDNYGVYNYNWGNDNDTNPVSD